MALGRRLNGWPVPPTQLCHGLASVCHHSHPHMLNATQGHPTSAAGGSKGLSVGAVAGVVVGSVLGEAGAVWKRAVLLAPTLRRHSTNAS
jgi:hypothetical protein